MKLLIVLGLFICTSFASEFIPKEFAPPPNTKPKDVPPPLTELAEKEGFSAHLAYTNKLNSDVQNIQKQDINEAAGIVTGVKDLLKKTAKKALTANKRASLEAEKVENDDGNTAAAGIYMEDKIKKVNANAKRATDALDVVKADADAKVQQAQKDVLAKNEIIQGKNQEIEGLNTRLKEEADRQTGICEEKLEAQSRAKDEQMNQAIQLKESEINSANDAKAKAEEAVEEAKRKCTDDMKQQQTANDQAMQSQKQQMESLKQDIKNKEETINQKDEEKAQAIQEESQKCDGLIQDTKNQQQEACSAQVQKVDDSLKSSQQEVENLNAKVVEIETRVTKEKEDAIAELQTQLDSLKEACTQEVRDAKAAANEEGDRRLNEQKAADREKLKRQQDLTAKCLSDSQVNMANKEQQCKDQRAELREELAEVTGHLEDRKARYNKLQNKLESLRQTIKDQTEQAKKASEAAENAMKLAPPVADANNALTSLLEDEVASPVNTELRTSSTALAVYTSLILSALFLCGLIFKLRGHLAKHKNYSAVMVAADA